MPRFSVKLCGKVAVCEGVKVTSVCVCEGFRDETRKSLLEYEMFSPARDEHTQHTSSTASSLFFSLFLTCVISVLR